MSVSDVADLLGDDEKTVKIHYGRWVRERQARLTGIVKSAFSVPGRDMARASGRNIVRHRSKVRDVQNRNRRNTSREN